MKISKLSVAVATVAVAAFALSAGANEMMIKGLNFKAPTVAGTANVNTPEKGEIVFDSTANGFAGYNGSAWTTFGNIWNQSSGNISYTAGKVGIGVAPFNDASLVVKATNGWPLHMMGSPGMNTSTSYADGANYLDFIGVETASGTHIFGSGRPYAFVMGTYYAHPLSFWTGSVERLVIDGAGPITAYSPFAATQGAQIATTATQPTCASGIRGTVWVVRGGTGVADVPQICLKDASDAYVWTNL